MICNPSGSEGLCDLFSTGRRESQKGREVNKVGNACLSPSEKFSIVAVELHINVRLTHCPPPTEEGGGGVRINKPDDFFFLTVGVPHQ